jgi:hypothetical protein
MLMEQHGVNGMPVEKPINDGFLYSLSMVYQPIVYRASALAQMEVLRRAVGYRVREYVVPNSGNNPIAAYSQLEQQVNTVAGAYLWGLTFSAPFNASGNDPGNIYIQITDACTESPLFSDYVLASQFNAVAPSDANGWNRRNPPLLAQPLLIGPPGLLDVELYNSASVAIKCQLVLLMAEPCIPPKQVEELLRLSRTGQQDRQ